MTANDQLVRAMLGGGIARVLWVRADHTVAAMAQAHGLRGGAVRLAAELAITNVLMSAWIKGEERVGLRLQADVPAVTFHGEVDAEGHFRGRFSPAYLRESVEKIEGLMLAIKSDAKAELYRGITKIEGEPVAVALERHLATSDQVLAAVRLQVEDGDQGLHGVGLLLEGLPGCSRGDFQLLCELVDGMGLAEVGDALHTGRVAVFSSEIVEDRPLVWQCRCSREKVEGILRGLGADTLREMICEDAGAEVGCEFCGTTYIFDEAALAAQIPMGLRGEA